MAVFHRIEYFGIGFDRDIALPDEARDRTSGSVSSPNLQAIGPSLPKLDEELVISRPWYVATNLCLPVDTALYPSSSFMDLVPETLFASPDPERGDVSPVSVDRADLWRTIEWVPDHLMPLNRYIGCPERHERILFSLAVDTQCQEPFQDYLPCPGSGPLSAAGSMTSEYARRPGAVYIPALVQTSTSAPFLLAAANTNRPTTPTHGAPIMMRRFLEDHQELNWISDVLELPPRSPSPREETQICRRLDEAPPLTTRLSLSHFAHPESSPSLGQCLGKRALPHWDTDLVPENPDVLTPDDEEEDSNILIYTIRSALVKERMYAMSTGRPRHHKVQRVHKRRAKSCRADGGSSPLSATKDCGIFGNPDRNSGFQ